MKAFVMSIILEMALKAISTKVITAVPWEAGGLPVCPGSSVDPPVAG
jgi:hypothetical protein